jgi:hypothetical protein
VCVCLFHHFGAISSSMSSVLVIYNVSLVTANTNSTIIPGTCDECLCAVLLNATLSACFNCFRNNNTCEMFSTFPELGLYSLANNSESSFYFFSLPNYDTTLAIAPSTSSSTSELLFIFFTSNYHVMYAKEENQRLHPRSDTRRSHSIRLGLIASVDCPS